MAVARRSITWLVALGGLAGTLGSAIYMDHRQKEHKKQLAKERDDASTKPPRQPNQVRVGKDEVYATEKAREVQWVPQLAIYGRVVPHPGATSEIRALFAGKLRQAADRPWPGLAQWTKSGEVIGWLEVRVGPQERLDLEARRTEAAVKLQGAREIQRLRQERVDRLKKFAASQNELDSALVDLADATMHLKLAQAADKQWQQAADSLDEGKGAWTRPIVMSADGEITEIAVRPGMMVEAGAFIARTADFRKVMVRMDLPANVMKDHPPATLDMIALPATPSALEGASNRLETWEPPVTFQGTLVGITGQLDASSQFVGCLYEVDNRAFPPLFIAASIVGLPSGQEPIGAAAELIAAASEVQNSFCRPGLFVKALLKAPEARTVAAVSIPETALVYHLGRPMVYRYKGAARFERMEVRLLGRNADRWIVASEPNGIGADDAIVVDGAQSLLSEEFRQAGDDD